MQNHLISNSNEQPKYFFLLDIFRGLAALAVVLWHWKNFYYKNNLPDNFDEKQQPLYSVLYIFYHSGSVAVDLFFLISGFIFFKLYAKKIIERRVKGKTFFLLRFSRLYPLQFLTLLLVLFLQQIIFLNSGHYRVYPNNDLYDFILNLFFANSWGFEKGPSFNGPNWSVSVEVLLYFLFFILCWFKLNKKYILWMLIFAGFAIQSIYSPIGRGLYSFFLGGILYYVYLAILKNHKAAVYLKWVRALAIIFSVLAIFDFKYSFFESYSLKFLSSIHFNHDNVFVLSKITNLIVRTIIFPLYILYAVLLETVKGARGKRFAFIGHISYSSYLLHFPLQLAVIIICGKLNVISPAFFNSAFTLAGFFTVLIIVSLLSFYQFELPVQGYLRSRLIKQKKL